MPYQTRWYNTEKTLVYTLFYDEWNWAELFQSMRLVEGLQSSVPYPSNAIYDLSQGHNHSLRGAVFYLVALLKHYPRPQGALTLIVTDQVVPELLLEMASVLADYDGLPPNIEIAPTLAEALARVEMESAPGKNGHYASMSQGK